MEALIDLVLRVAGDHVNAALAPDDGVFAGRNREPRLLDPAAGICRFRRDAGHITLFLDRLRDVGDGLVVETEKERKFVCHDRALSLGSSGPRPAIVSW